MKLSRKLRRIFYRISHYPPRIAYALGLGPLVGRVILLLTTRGRKSGLDRVTPLQYEEVGGDIYIGSAMGRNSDWLRNIQADPCVEVRAGKRRFQGAAEVVTEPRRIADYLELRLERHPQMVGLILKMEGLPTKPARSDLEKYAERLSMVVIRNIENKI